LLGEDTQNISHEHDALRQNSAKSVNLLQPERLPDSEKVKLILITYQSKYGSTQGRGNNHFQLPNRTRFHLCTGDML
jgi:hypothetical protein